MLNKSLPLISALLLSSYVYSQNNFPSTGNVAIGTTNPQNTLDVGGSGGRFTGAFTETTSNTGIHVGISGTPRIGFFNGTTYSELANRQCIRKVKMVPPRHHPYGVEYRWA